MSAQHIFGSAPLGATIRFTDGTPRPPDRFRRKLSQWKDRNDTGRLVEKCAGRGTGACAYPATFTLHMATCGSDGTIVLVVNRTFTVASDLSFEIVERPRPGMVRVLTSFQGSTTLRHLAPDMNAARAWLAEHHYHDARFEVVADEDAIVGRAA